MATETLPKTRLTSRSTDGPLRVALVGCGAVAREFHLPVLAGHDKVRLVALVDRAVGGAKELAAAYGVGTVLGDAEGLDADTVDAVVIATPPYHHAGAAISFMKRGLHVLVEKPMALSVAEAEEMVRVGEEHGVVLSVGLFRRILPSVRVLKAMVAGNVYGRPVGFDIAVGGFYNWPAATLGNLKKEQAGGGVLMDMGAHVLDQLLYILPGEARVLESRDNALGGVEADCELTVRIALDGAEIEGRISLARTRELRNTIRMECERAVLDLPFSETREVSVLLKGLDTLEDPVTGGSRAFALKASWADSAVTVGYAAFRAEVDDWLGAIDSGIPPQLDGRSALASMRLIADSYRIVQPLEEPWVSGGVVAAKSNMRVESAGQGRVLVTGASGFVGCRVVETLVLREKRPVRALVHNPGSAARLARLPVEIIQGDLKDPEVARRAVEGCEAVIHCAIGTAWGQRREIFAVTVGGTKHLADAARAAGVSRFVHLSSVALHDPEVPGVLDESTPISPPRGDDYAESKSAAEMEVLRAAASGLPAVIFRPGCVFGPFSQTFVIRPIRFMKQGRLFLVGTEGTASNTLYIDNLVHAILLGLDAPAELARGEVFTLSDGDLMSWEDYYGYFAAELGYQVKTKPPAGSENSRSGKSGILRSLWNGGLSIAKSPEFRGLGRRVLETDPIGTVPRSLLERSPGLDRRLRKLVGADAATVYRPPAQSDRSDVYEVFPRQAQISVGKARRVLGYEPVVSKDVALDTTLKWLRAAGLA